MSAGSMWILASWSAAQPLRHSGQGKSTAQDDDAAWRAAVFFAAEEVELAVRGEGWGLHLEGGSPLLVTATADSIARFVGEPSAGISLDDGAVVSEFGL